MKKKTLGLLLLLFVTVAAMIIGCNTGTDEGTSETKSIVTWAYTLSSGSSVQNLLIGFGCSDADISGTDTKSLTLPSGATHYMSTLTGSYTGQHFYVGTSTTDLGQVSDPYYESTQRQFSTGNITGVSSLNGTYTGKLKDKTKNFTFNQTNFMSALSEADVATGTGGTILNVTGGDTITISNQNTSSVRYYCVIYNGSMGNYGADNIWASADIRKIDYVDIDDYANFLVNDTVAPVNGTVTFTVPGGILTPGTDNLDMVIYAVNTSTLNSDTSGDIRTIVYAYSMLTMNLDGQ